MGIPGMPNFDGLIPTMADALHYLAQLAENAANATTAMNRIADALEEQNEINKDIKDLFHGPIGDAPKAEYTGEALRRHYTGLSNPYGD